MKSTHIKYHLILGVLILFFVSCMRNGKQQIKDDFKHSNFLLRGLGDCYIKNLELRDSEYGELVCQNFILSFDLGYCNYSNDEVHSSNDYLSQNKWLIQLFPTLISGQEKVLLDTIFNKIKILSIDDELNAEIEYENRVINPDGRSVPLVPLR